MFGLESRDITNCDILAQAQVFKQVRAFTEHGALMAASILNSPRAVAMSVYVIRAFVMKLYNKLLAAAVDAIAKAFQKRFAAGLQSARDFIIPNEQDQARETTDFELITWLVIKCP